MKSSFLHAYLLPAVFLIALLCSSEVLASPVSVIERANNNIQILTLDDFRIRNRQIACRVRGEKVVPGFVRGADRFVALRRFLNRRALVLRNRQADPRQIRRLRRSFRPQILRHICNTLNETHKQPVSLPADYEANRNLADINQDGEINALDLNLLLSLIGSRNSAGFIHPYRSPESPVDLSDITAFLLLWLNPPPADTSPTPDPSDPSDPLPTPDPNPGPHPTITPTPTVSPEPTSTPTPTITATPTSTATPEPTSTPTPTSTATPEPTFTPTPTPTATPEPTLTPTPTPTATPTPTPTATPTPPPSGDLSVLEPGNGFNGATSQPAAVGNSSLPGYYAKAIARWDVVPHQTFDGIFEIGIVAFHMNGIDRVDFSVENGPWISVNEMSLNPRTGVVEYWTNLDASLFSEAGPIEVRAIVYPENAGVPRVLAGNSSNGEHSLFLNVDPGGEVLANREIRYVAPWGSNTTGNGTQGNPYATIRRAAQNIYVAQGGRADNGLIYLFEGDHPWESATGWHQHPETFDAWLTVTSAPGVERSDVRITYGSNDRVNTALAHLKNVTIRSNLYSSTNLNMPARIWFDNCTLTGTGPTNDQTFATGWVGGIYSTDSIIRDVRNGFKGGARLERNVTLSNLGEDAFFNSPLIINAQINGIDTTGVPDDPHPDIAQYSNVRHNNIIYGLQAINATSQGIFMRSISDTPSSDIAFVNILIEMHPHTYLNQILNSVDHLLLWHVTLANRPLRIDHDPDNNNSYQTVIRDASLRNNVFHEAFPFSSHFHGPTTIDNNHFITGSPMGNNATVGEPDFVSSENQQYQPGENSILGARVYTELVPVDVLNNPLSLPAAIGALQPE